MQTSEQKFSLEFHPEALEEWKALDKSVREVLKKKLAKRLNEPRVQADALRNQLSGCYKIKNRSSGHRIVYEVFDSELIVYVIAVDKRADSIVYTRAASRR